MKKVNHVSFVPTQGGAIQKIERQYKKLDEILSRCGDYPEIAIKAYRIEQRLDALVEKMIKANESSNN